MKYITKNVVSALAGAMLLAGTALAQPAGEAAKPRTAQQEKMATCNQQADGKKGDERKAFMKQCLSAKPVSQQDKMKACNQQAGDMKGDDRKKFMSGCLKKTA